MLTIMSQDGMSLASMDGTALCVTESDDSDECTVWAKGIGRYGAHGVKMGDYPNAEAARAALKGAEHALELDWRTYQMPRGEQEETAATGKRPGGAGASEPLERGTGCESNDAQPTDGGEPGGDQSTDADEVPTVTLDAEAGRQIASSLRGLFGAFGGAGMGDEIEKAQEEVGQLKKEVEELQKSLNAGGTEAEDPQGGGTAEDADAEDGFIKRLADRLKDKIGGNGNG